MTKAKYVILTLILTSLFFFKGTTIVAGQTDTPTPTPTSGVTPTPNNSGAINDLQNKIKNYQDKVNALQGQVKTLSSQIQIMDNQINITELRVQAAKQKLAEFERNIEITKNRIENLEESITASTKALIGRIDATYQVGRLDPWQVFLTSNNISNFLTRLTYLKVVQANDKKTIYAAQQSKSNYANEKAVLEGKQKEVEAVKAELVGYTAQLDKDKETKQIILEETRGSEANYQRLLASARAEYEAIQGIISGNGTEGEIGNVNQGDVIASIIQSSSCNSSGTHLHFTVSRNGTPENPFNHLKSVDHTDNSNGDPFNPSGSWDWPIDSPIQLNQGYGSDTWYVRTHQAFYPFHNGLDISTSNLTVRAVKSGVLFQGSYTGKTGCRLKYVRVHHSDNGLDTFYLHVNYVR